jgi:hypothetical protein
MGAAPIHTNRQINPLIFTIAGSVLIVILAGCSGPRVASVSGTVKYNNELVKGGTVTFSPEGTNPGPPATGTVNASGEYVLQTQGSGSGAVVGKHRVTYLPPEAELTEAQRSDPKYKAPLSPYLGLVPTVAEVEVKTGKNVIDIELKKKK